MAAGNADAGWRLIQIAHNGSVRGILAREVKSGGAGFRGWEAAPMFCEIAVAAGGYDEMRGSPTPTSHKARMAIVKRHLPHLAETYNDLYAMSVAARYYNGYAMTENAGRMAERCHETLAKSIPVQ